MDIRQVNPWAMLECEQLKNVAIERVKHMMSSKRINSVNSHHNPIMVQWGDIAWDAMMDHMIRAEYGYVPVNFSSLPSSPAKATLSSYELCPSWMAVWLPWWQRDAGFLDKLKIQSLHPHILDQFSLLLPPLSHEVSKWGCKENRTLLHLGFCWLMLGGGGGAGRRTGGLSWADMGGISETVSMEVHHTDPDSSLLCLWCCFEFTTIFWHPSSHPLAFGAGSSLLETCVGLTPQVGTDCSVPEEKGLSPSLICSCSVESCSPASLFPIDGYQCNPENGGSETGFSLTMRGCFFQGKGPDASATPLGKNMGVSALIFILHHCYVISFILSLLKKKDLFWEVQRSNIALKQEMSIIFYY